MQKLGSPKIVVCLVRHGQTDDNVTGTIGGHRQTKLTKVGTSQAVQTGKALGNANFDYVYVSDLARTRQTFDGILSTAPQLQGVKVEYSPLLREKKGGILEGRNIKVWKENADKQKLNIRRYKCNQGENWEDVYERSHKFIHQLIKTHLVQNPNTSNTPASNPQVTRILVVTHGGFIMQTHNLVNWLKSKHEPVFLNVAKNCSFHQFEFSYKGGPTQKIDDSLIQCSCIKNNLTQY